MSTIARDKLLDSIQKTFGLTGRELAGLFGVSRQAVEQWHQRGVPSDRQAKAAALAAIADLLSRRLKPERIPGIARRPAPVYDGLTMLELIERDRHYDLLEQTRRSFDWAVTA